MLLLLLRGLFGFIFGTIRFVVIGTNKAPKTKYDDEKKVRHAK